LPKIYLHSQALLIYMAIQSMTNLVLSHWILIQKAIAFASYRKLSTDLFEHSNTIPPMNHLRSSSADMGDDGVYQGTQGCQDYSKYHVDETLRLTQNLIDVYPAFLNAIPTTPDIQPSNASSTWSSDRMFKHEL